MTLNVEGLHRNVHNLRNLVSFHDPDWVFLSETQIFVSDIDLCLDYFKGDYESYLNSQDRFDPEMPLMKTKAFGGTMIMWRRDYDPYVTLYPPPSSAILPVIFHPPGLAKTIHICVYLPTHGHDEIFLGEIEKLMILLTDLSVHHPGTPVFIRGDFNVNEKNSKRRTLLDHLLADFSLIEMQIDHPTYHHFMGNGRSDSNIDKVLCPTNTLETLLYILCRNEDPIVNISSSHDIIMSSWPARLQTTR